MNNEYNSTKNSEKTTDASKKMGANISGANTGSTLGGKTNSPIQSRDKDREGLAINPKGVNSKSADVSEEDEDQDDLALNSQLDKNKKVDPSVSKQGVKQNTTHNSNFRA